MKKLFIYPEINLAELTHSEEIMVSGNPLVNASEGVTYVNDTRQGDIGDNLKYWSGKQ